MTKEEYLKLRNEPEIPMSAWFEFYRENGGVLDFVEFEKVFTTLTWNQSVVTGSDGQPKQIKLGTAMFKFYKHYNEKFAV